MSEENITQLTITDGGALRVILELEDNRKVIAVLRPDGSLVQPKDIPEWVWRAMRHRGLLFSGDIPTTEEPSQEQSVVAENLVGARRTGQSSVSLCLLL